MTYNKTNWHTVKVMRIVERMLFLTFEINVLFI